MPLPVGQMLACCWRHPLSTGCLVIDPVSGPADSIGPVSPSVCGTITTDDPSADQATLDRFQRGGSPLGAPVGAMGSDHPQRRVVGAKHVDRAVRRTIRSGHHQQLPPSGEYTANAGRSWSANSAQRSLEDRRGCRPAARSGRRSARIFIGAELDVGEYPCAEPMSVTESRVDAEVGVAGINGIATDVGPGDIDTAGVADPGCVVVPATATGATARPATRAARRARRAEPRPKGKHHEAKCRGSLGHCRSAVHNRAAAKNVVHIQAPDLTQPVDADYRNINATPQPIAPAAPVTIQPREIAPRQPDGVEPTGPQLGPTHQPADPAQILLVRAHLDIVGVARTVDELITAVQVRPVRSPPLGKALRGRDCRADRPGGWRPGWRPGRTACRRWSSPPGSSPRTGPAAGRRHSGACPAGRSSTTDSARHIGNRHVVARREHHQVDPLAGAVGEHHTSPSNRATPGLAAMSPCCR